ncbi:MAG: RagB/SusD family nutrient uptake outer membrane protein [Tannerella sp.]|jgi:hypothetical protein|nr:RagB/SusD family nutrient uptake outer membrane protein [Tannerella sp.]
MKRINKYIISLICVAAIFTACNDDFLDRAPQTAITGGGFFKTVSDVEIYVNRLYTESAMPGYANQDFDSDNVTTYLRGSDAWNALRGNLSKENVSGDTWNAGKWAQLRAVNYLLENVQDVSGTEADLQHFLGIARFFRANFYIGMIDRYSDVPWTNKALGSDDPDVFKPADPRTLVADSIVADLEYASAHIKTTLGNRTRVNRYTALTLLSRFCLYEGTFRRYHPELNLASTAEPFLQRAATAAEEIMNSGQFEITGKGVLDMGNDMYRAPGYQDLFHSLNLGANKEVILWVDYSQHTVGVINNVLNTYASLSRSLMETFLMRDGSRFTAQAGYATKTYVEVFKNRDPRFAQVFAYPGFKGPEGDYYATPELGGYGQLKHYPIYQEQVLGGGNFYAAMLTYRYAEALLNYAEAKAELGTLTQNDLDRSITLLRDRVEMPALNMTTANASIDPILAAQYPNVTGANKGVLLEIRRERRVELACESLRNWDLHRWYAGRLFGERQQGIYIPALGAYDVTGDGVNDVALLNNVGDELNYPEEERSRLLFYYLHDENGKENLIYLENGVPGHLMMRSDRDEGKEFKEPQYYYRPIPIGETVLNPNLTQPFGW